MKKLLVSFIITLAAIMLPVASHAAQAPSIDTTKLDNGIVAVSYKAQDGSKLKVMVEKSGSSITYDLKGDGSLVSYPLQFGDGDYKVSVLENIEGTKYRYLTSENIKLNLEDDKKVYLASIQNINWSSNMAAIKKAAELTKGLKSDKDRINAIYQYTVGSIKYDYDKLKTLKNDYVPNIDNTVNSGKGICYDYASLMAAMLRSQGIPAKLVKGYSTNASGYHAWNEVYNSETGKWMIIDATYDSQLKDAKIKYNFEKLGKEYTKVYEY